MAKQYLRRKSSIPAIIYAGQASVEIEESDLRWRRSSHAALTAMLPSHGTYHSDTSIASSHSTKDLQRKKSAQLRRKSMAAIRESLARQSSDDSIPSTHQLAKGMSEMDQWLLEEENRLHAVESIRNMTASLTVKRKYRNSIFVKESTRPKGFEQKKYQLAKKWQRFKDGFKSAVYRLELWSGAFKVIEGQFGTATVSYFRFLRWLMFLNMTMTVFMVAIVFVPFMLIQPGTNFMSSLNDACASVYHYRAVFLSNNYSHSTSDIASTESAGTLVLDVLQGTGWLENTELFYGKYHNKTSSLFVDSPIVYHMGLAYLFAVGLSFLLSFALLLKNSAKGFKQSGLMNSTGSVTLYCNKVFGAWDYCISQPKTANLKHKNIQQDLMNELEYQRLQWKKDSRTKREKAKLYSIRILINLLVISILSGSLYLIYYTNTELISLTLTEKNQAMLLLLQYLPSIVLMLLSAIVPTIFKKVVVAEDYMPEFSIRITLIRTVLLRLASLGILIISLYTGLTKSRKYNHIDIPCSNISAHEPNVSPTALINTHDNSTSNVMEDYPCWENYVGQQIYKLVILNFLVVVGVTFLVEFPRKRLYKRFHKDVKVINLVGQQQFDLTNSVLDLIYLQTLCWLGMFFSPFIPAMCFIKCFIFFYVKKTSLIHNYLPMQQYGTSKSNSLFMMVLLLSFGLAAIPIAAMIGMIQPSEACGPFRVYSSEGYIMFDAVTNLINLWEDGKPFFHFIGTGGFMCILGFLVCFLMFYFYISGQAYYEMAERLREQLKTEGHDKQFLLARVNEVLDLADVREETEENANASAATTTAAAVSIVIS